MLIFQVSFKNVTIANFNSQAKLVAFLVSFSPRITDKEFQTLKTREALLWSVIDWIYLDTESGRNTLKIEVLRKL